MSKKLYPIQLTGATVCFFTKDQRIGFLDSLGIIFWIDLGANKAFSKMTFVEGAPVWIYVVRELSRIMAVVPNLGEKIDDMPQMEPVEL
jgi:hypothetical protein